MALLWQILLVLSSIVAYVIMATSTDDRSTLLLRLSILQAVSGGLGLVGIIVTLALQSEVKKSA